MIEETGRDKTGQYNTGHDMRMKDMRDIAKQNKTFYGIDNGIGNVIGYSKYLYD